MCCFILHRFLEVLSDKMVTLIESLQIQKLVSSNGQSDQTDTDFSSGTVFFQLLSFTLVQPNEIEVHPFF